MRDARMLCAMAGCDARWQDAMSGCDARCQDAMRDGRMRCSMLHSILASHPDIAHRILPSRIASCHRASHPSIAHRILASRIAHRILASHPSIAHRILASRIALQVINDDTMVLLGHHSFVLVSSAEVPRISQTVRSCARRVQRTVVTRG